MQASAQTQVAPPAPAAPIAAPAPVSITVVGLDGKTQTLAIPRTAAELTQLQAQREELSDQLTSVSARRTELAEELSTTTDGAARAGLENRLGVLDRRIIQLETDLASTGRQLSSAPSDLVASTGDDSQSGVGGHFDDGFMAGGLSALLLIPVAVFFARRRWRTPSKPVPAQLGGESAQRLERLEQGMEAIAIEIERVSEGQRFVTKLLSEAQSPFGGSRATPDSLAVKREDPAER
jgi:hypothetical protein